MEKYLTSQANHKTLLQQLLLRPYYIFYKYHSVQLYGWSEADAIIGAIIPKMKFEFELRLTLAIIENWY